MKYLFLLALILTVNLYAQNNFHAEIEMYGHRYKAVINTEYYVKWLLVDEKNFYLAPDSTTSHLMTDAEWMKYRQGLKQNGFNELDSDYYWNPKTKTVVMLDKERHRNGMLHVSTEFGTDIK